MIAQGIIRKGKLEVVPVTGMDSVARINRQTGKLYINKEKFSKLPKKYQRYIIAHEEGHYRYNTSDEFMADQFAFDKLAGKFPGSLKTSVKALSEVLDFNNPQHWKRVDKALKRALLYDWKKYNNTKAKEAYLKNYGGNIESFDGKRKTCYAPYFIAILLLLTIIIILILKLKK